MRIPLPPARWIRVACLVAFALVLAQLFLLDEPPLVRELKDFVWDKSLHAMAFGSFALLLWFGVGYRSPIGNCFAIRQRLAQTPQPRSASFTGSAAPPSARTRSMIRLST